MRLIDAEVLEKKCLEDIRDNNANIWDLMDNIRKQPTAYDVEKVVAEMVEADSGYCWMCGGGIDCKTAIDIVRKGGVE